MRRSTSKATTGDCASDITPAPMQMQIILVDLGLAVSCFVCGLAVAYVAWFAFVNEAPDDAAPGRRKFHFRFWGSLLSLLLFAAGLYDLQQLAAQRFVPWTPAFVQASVLGFFALWALTFFLIYRRHGRIQTLLDNGQTDEAIELLEHWIQTRRPPRADLHSMLGMIHLNSSNPELAVEELRRAVEISNLPMYLCNLAIALNTLGCTDEALSLLERAERKDPGSRGVYTHNRCYFLAKAGRVEEARALLPQVEQYHQQMTHMPPLQQRQLAETLSEMQQLCEHPSTDSHSD